VQLAGIVPVMEDRARQAVHMQALQPIAETTADGNSYGFLGLGLTTSSLKEVGAVSTACWSSR